MKKCPQCLNENPSTAKHCMHCGMLLQAEEELTEEDRLKRKLRDAEEENRLLKAALGMQLKKDSSTIIQEKDIVSEPEPAINPIPLDEPNDTYQQEAKKTPIETPQQQAKRQVRRDVTIALVLLFSSLLLGIIVLIVEFG